MLEFFKEMGDRLGQALVLNGMAKSAVVLQKNQLVECECQVNFQISENFWIFSPQILKSQIFQAVVLNRKCLELAKSIGCKVNRISKISSRLNWTKFVFSWLCWSAKRGFNNFSFNYRTTRARRRRRSVWLNWLKNWAYFVIFADNDTVWRTNRYKRSVVLICFMRSRFFLNEIFDIAIFPKSALYISPITRFSASSWFFQVLENVSGHSSKKRLSEMSLPPTENGSR